MLHVQSEQIFAGQALKNTLSHAFEHGNHSSGSDGQLA